MLSIAVTTEKSNPKRQRGSRHVNDGMPFLANASGYQERDFDSLEGATGT